MEKCQLIKFAKLLRVAGCAEVGRPRMRISSWSKVSKVSSGGGIGSSALLSLVSSAVLSMKEESCSSTSIGSSTVPLRLCDLDLSE